jgi:hypothetical protein
MSQTSKCQNKNHDTARQTTAELIAQIAKDTASLANRRAWTEILARLRAEGRSASRANELRNAVWVIRKQKAAAARTAEVRDVANVSCACTNI